MGQNYKDTPTELKLPSASSQTLDAAMRRLNSTPLTGSNSVSNGRVTSWPQAREPVLRLTTEQNSLGSI